MKKYILSVTCFLSSLLIWGQNTAPTITSIIEPNTNICVNQQDQIVYSNIVISDADGDNLSIVSMTEVDPNTLSSPQEINLVNTTGSISFDIRANGVEMGDANIDLYLTDGVDTFYFALVDAMVVAGPTITYNQSAVICANAGEVNLNQFVTPTGGIFSYEGIPYSGGNYNPLADGQTENYDHPIEYTYSDGNCSTQEYFSINVIFSPTITISTTTTSCSSASGTATASILETGNTIYESWSNGAISTSSITNLAAGSYVYYHTDTSNCITTKSFTINTSDVTITPTITHVNCFGQATGAISITQSGLVDPIQYVWSTGKTNVTSISGLKAGTYSLYATDTNNCHVVQHFTVNENPKIIVDVDVDVNPTCGQQDGTAIVYNIEGGTNEYTILWNTGLNGSTLSNIGFGTYTVTVTDTAGCAETQTVYVSEIDGAEIYGDAFTADCESSNGKIVTDIVANIDPIESILWSNGATTANLTNVPAGHYACTVTVENSGCKSIKGWNIPTSAPLVQELCILTVDTATTTNLLVWDKVQPIGVDYYNIYRETSNQGEYLLIDTVSANNLSMFNDVVASPMERSWSYKISAVNFCGVESPLSNMHKTINLNIIDIGNTDVQVSWNAYQGATFDSYKLFRYTNANGWELAATVSSNMLSYVDNIDFNTAGLDYMVEFELEEACTAEKAQDFNTTRSNRERGQMTTGVGVDGASNNSVAINYLNSIQAFPNPTSDNVTFVQTENEQVVYTVTSLSGQVVSTISSNDNMISIDLSNLYSGIYLVELKLNDIKVVKRIVKI